MSFTIIRNDITKMNTDAIVNTANKNPVVGPGCDTAVYNAAGYEELLAYRKEHIGFAEEGSAFITPGFRLPARYIIHAVSPRFIDGKHGEEELLRSCYRKSLALAAERGIRSIAFPLISTGGFGYPKEEGMRIAIDEIHAFLLTKEMRICLVVFDEKATRMGRNLYPDLETYIDRNYVEKKHDEEYWGIPDSSPEIPRPHPEADVREPHPGASRPPAFNAPRKKKRPEKTGLFHLDILSSERQADEEFFRPAGREDAAFGHAAPSPEYEYSETAIDEIPRKLEERMAHMADTFPQYLLYLISEKGMENSEVYKRAIVDKKVFSKIRTNPDYHPQKLTALCLCIGAKLNLDESKDLLARAGYALSPCDKTDIIFSYFIEHGIYDMIELDIQLEEHGLPCIIT